MLLLPTSARAESSGQQLTAQQIASEIRESGQLSRYRLGVSFKDGVAWLEGSVTDASQSQKAEQLASQIDGVKHVVNKLEIKPQQGKVKMPTQSSASEATSGLLLAMQGEEEEDNGVEEAAFEPSTRRPAARNRTQGRSMRRQPTRQRMPAPIARTARRMPQGMPVQQASNRNVRPANYGAPAGGGYVPAGGMGGASGVSYDSPNMPGYAWPSYASHPNYSAVTYPKQYSPTAWPYIGPFYPYPQVPLGWRKVALEWDDGWWHLDFSHHQHH